MIFSLCAVIFSNNVHSNFCLPLQVEKKSKQKLKEQKSQVHWLNKIQVIENSQKIKSCIIYNVM